MMGYLGTDLQYLDSRILSGIGFSQAQTLYFGGVLRVSGKK